MALKESSSQMNGSVKTEGERLAIAKEVIIKALLPVVFGIVGRVGTAPKAEVRTDSPVENKATDKQIKKIFAMGHNLNMGKEELEEEAFKVSGIDSLSKLSKSQASDLIDDLSAMEGIQEIYG